MADYERLWGVRVLGIAADSGELCSDGSFAPDADQLDGASCATSGSTGAAMEIVSDLSQRPHVAVIDLGSKADGFDVCGVAGQLSNGFSIPVLFAMGRSDVMHMNEAIAAQPAGYLHKPVTADALRKAIADLVPERPRPVPEPVKADPEPVVARTSPPEPPAVDEEKPQAPSPPEKKIELPRPSASKPLPVITKLQAPADSLGDAAEEPEEEPSVQSSSTSSQAGTSAGFVSQDTTNLHPSTGSTAGVDWQREMRGQQLQGLGLLGRGFAHEFNNLLTVLIGN